MLRKFPSNACGIALLLLCHTAFGHAPDSVGAFEGGINKGKLLTQHFRQTFPVQYTADSAMVIDVTVKGKKRRFLLDTGAPLCVSKNLMQESNFPVLSDETLRDSNGDTSSVRIVSVPELAIGSIGFGDIPALVFDMESFPFHCDGLDGIIGSNLLRLLVIRFDKQKGEVTLTDQPESLLLDSAFNSRLFLDAVQSDPQIIVQIGDRMSDTCTFDTGDNSFYIFSSKQVKKMKKNKKAMRIVAEGTGLSSIGMGGKAHLDKKSHLVRADRLSIGGAAFTGVTAVPTNADKSRVGRGLLEYGVVTMDYPRGKFYFQPTRALVYDSTKSFGIKYLELRGKLLVATVWEDSEAKKKGLRPGMEILQFGNFTPSAIPPCQWREALSRETSGQELKLVYLSNGEKKTVVLPARHF